MREPGTSWKRRERPVALSHCRIPSQVEGELLTFPSKVWKSMNLSARETQTWRTDLWTMRVEEGEGGTNGEGTTEAYVLSYVK